MLSIFSCASWPSVCLLWRNVCISPLYNAYVGPFFKKDAFIHLVLATLGLLCCVCAFSRCGKQGLLFAACMSFSLQLLLSLRSTGSRLVDFSICGVWTQKLCYMRLFVPWHVGSSWTRDRTCVPCVGRWILNH